MSIDLPGMLGPEDRVFTWWGAPGEVARAFHFEQFVTGPDGQPLGEIESEETITLLSYTAGAGR
jgi:hypothetical protein